jgi:hypothetical protein
MLRKMSNEHIDEVVRIHETSWDKKELSVKLGREFIKLFYSSIVQSKFAFGFVYVFNNKVIAYATGFVDYQAFNALFKKKNHYLLLKILTKAIFQNRLKFGDLINLLNDNKKFIKTKYKKHHLGALALANEYKGTLLGRKALKQYKMY